MNFHFIQFLRDLINRNREPMSLRPEEKAFEVNFANAAAADFKANPSHTTYGPTMPGTLLAIRWGMNDDCVLIVRVDPYYGRTIYTPIEQEGNKL